MGIWDKLFGAEGQRDETSPVEKVPDEGHHEVHEEAVADAAIRDVDDARVAPEDEVATAADLAEGSVERGQTAGTSESAGAAATSGGAGAAASSGAAASAEPAGDSSGAAWPAGASRRTGASRHAEASESASSSRRTETFSDEPKTSGTDELKEAIRRTPPRPMPGFSSERNSVDAEANAPAESAEPSREPEPAREPQSMAIETKRTSTVVAKESKSTEVESVERKSTEMEAVKTRTKDVMNVPPTPSSQTTGGQEQETPGDQRLLDSTVAILRDAGITPNREVTTQDVATCQPAGLAAFRARPLTTVIQLVDVDGQPLLSPVYRDVEDNSRTSPENLRDYAEELAEAAGTTEGLHIVTVPDPGSERRGSMSIRAGRAVRDVSYDLDPDFGDEAAEAALSYAVAPEHLITYPVVTDVQGERLTVWASKRTPRAFFTSLDGENSESCDGPTPRI